MEIQKNNKFCNYLKNTFNKIREAFKIGTQKKGLNYNDYIIKFDRLAYLVLMGFVIITSISIFIFNSINGSEKNNITWPLLAILLISFIICGVYFFIKKNEKTMKIFFYLLVLLMDSLIFCASNYSINVANDINLFSKYIYFFIFSKIIFAILKFNFSFFYILIYITYKSIIFGIIINLFSNKDNQKINFTIEIISFSLTCICVFLFTMIKQDFITKSMEFYTNNKFAIEYFQSLINTLNKGFLSLNLTNYTMNINKSFINFMKSIGISDENIHANLYNIEKKTEKSNLLNLRSFRKSRYSTRFDLKNTSYTNKNALKKSSVLMPNQTEITNKLNIEREKLKISTIDPKNLRGLDDLMVKDNNEIKTINYEKVKIEEEMENNNNSSKSKIELDKNKYDFNIIPICHDEDTFLLKIDFLLNYVFCYFYEESFNKGNSRNKPQGNERFSLSEAIKDIFYSKEKNINTDQNFIFKGVYESREKKIFKDNMQFNMILEVHYRKIKTINGDLIEFFFNDITLTRNVEMEKAENKVKAMVLAKVSHEFKTPLITIIYILKNYIKKTHYSKNGVSLEHVNTYDNDYIANTIDLSDYMLSLINDIVDYSVINSEFEFKCEFDNFDLHDLLLFGYRILKILINCRGLKDYVHPLLEINENVPKNFCSDEKRVKQILLNLITNSIKFTRRGYIKISAVISHENSLMISIEDTGIGIQSKDISKLFKDHSKLWDKASAEMNKIGSGLGLSICKKIVEKIGKCIEVESIPNKKTRFFFILENKHVMKKAFSVNRSIEKNLAQFKKSIMNVTTKSVKEAKLSFQNPGRPKSFNTHVQVSRFNDNNNLSINNMFLKRIMSDYTDDPNNNNNNNVNRASDIEGIKFSNSSNNSNLGLNNLISNTNNIFNNINTNVIDISKVHLSSEEDTVKYTDTKQKFKFSYEMMDDCSNSSGSVKFRIPDFNPQPIIKKENKKEYNKGIKSSAKSELDRNFLKLIKPIKKYFDMKNKDIILVVDDNKFLRKSLKTNIRSIFNDTSVDVIGCSDGIETLYLAMIDQMTNNRIKLIISDENMVYMSGTESNLILSSFHIDGKMNFIPFSLCSAARNDDEYLIRNKINYKLNKPPSKNELKSLFITLNLI